MGAIIGAAIFIIHAFLSCANKHENNSKNEVAIKRSFFSLLP